MKQKATDMCIYIYIPETGIVQHEISIYSKQNFKNITLNFRIQKKSNANDLYTT